MPADGEEDRIRSAELQNANSILLARRHAQEELRQQTELFRVTLSSIGDAVISTDADGRVTFMNEIAESLTGWSQADAATRPLDEIFCIVNEQTRATVENPAIRALNEGKIVGLANYTILIAKDGSEKSIDDKAALIRDAGGKVAGVVLVFRDISERKRQELVQEELNRLVAMRADVNSALALGGNTDKTLQTCGEALVLHLQVAFARIWTLNEADSVLELKASAGQYTHLDGAHSRIKVGDYKIGRIASSGEPHLTNDTYNDPNVSDRDWAKREGMLAFAGYPLAIDGRIVGVVAMFSRRILTENILKDLKPLAFVIAQFIDRKRSEHLLREQHERLRITLDSIGDAVISTDRNGNVANMNPIAELLTGWTNTEALGIPLESVFKIINETTRLKVESPVAKALAQGVIVGLANHTVLIAKDGTETAIDDSAAPIRSKDGEIIGCVLVFRDVSVSRRAENALRESEALNRSILESSPDCVKVLDPQGHLLQMNAHGQCLTEIDDFSTVAGRHWSELWPENGRQDVLNALDSVQHQNLSHFEGLCPTAKGTPKWWDVKVAPARNAEGEVVRVIAVSRDITERRKMEEALAESEERFRVMADSISQLAWTCDNLGHVTWYNQRWLEYTGLSFEAMQGWNWSNVQHPDHLERVVARVKRSGESGEMWEDTFPLLGKDGQYRWFLSRAIPFCDKDGNIQCWFGTNTDVTEQRESAEKLRQLAAELSENDRRKNEFLAMLAHELRNPLAPIRNAVQLVRLSNNDGDQARVASEIIERQVQHLVRLVDDLLDVSRISQGKIQLRMGHVEIGAVVRQAIETIRPAIDAGRHRLTLNLPAEPYYVRGDAVRLAQVFGNLLNNSCKYSDVEGHIQIAFEEQPAEIKISVRDSGIGIPAEMLPRVFELFTQVDRSLDRSQGGLGIGLTLVQRIVEMHDGSVSVTSEGAGKGSEFIVRLPEFVESEVCSPEIDKIATEKIAPRKVLVVDDNRDSASSLAMLLNVVGNDSRTAFDGDAAVETAAAFRPDVVLLDIGLPKLNGYEVARVIRGQPWGKTMVLVALTGWGQEEDKQKSRAAGFDHHLVKPVDFEELTKLFAKLPPALLA